MNLKEYIVEVSDFPRAGVNFKDITPLLNDAVAFNYAVESLISLVETKKIDKVVAMESRGFFLGPIVANKIGAGFVPIRKKGKLPCDILRQEYDLEYGTDVLEMHVEAINPGDKVLIHDDVLATGGTAEAAKKLVERAGGEVVQLDFIINLTFLDGASKLGNSTVNSLVEY